MPQTTRKLSELQRQPVSLEFFDNGGATRKSESAYLLGRSDDHGYPDVRPVVSNGVGFPFYIELVVAPRRPRMAAVRKETGRQLPTGEAEPTGV